MPQPPFPLVRRKGAFTCDLFCSRSYSGYGVFVLLCASAAWRVTHTAIARMCAHTGHTQFETRITSFVQLYYLQMILSELCLSNNEKCTDTLDKFMPFEQMKIYFHVVINVFIYVFLKVV